MISYSPDSRAELWIAGAEIIPSWMEDQPGEPKRAVWHTLERDAMAHPRVVADYINRTYRYMHLIWNPVTGEVVQMSPAGTSVSIGVIAKASEPFTSGPCSGLSEIVDWLTDLGIPQTWPAGPPMHPDIEGNRNESIWRTQEGHYGDSQIPHGTGTGPGAIDIYRIFAGAKIAYPRDHAREPGPESVPAGR